MEITDWYKSASVGAKVQRTTGMFSWDNGSQEGFNDNIVTRTPVDGENCVTIKNAKLVAFIDPKVVMLIRGLSVKEIIKF